MYPESSINLSYEMEDEVFFYSHAFDPLNNFSAHMIKIWMKQFATVEHAFQYKKFSESAPHIADLVHKANSPFAAKRIATQNDRKKRTDWHDVSLEIMEEVVREKILQHQDVRDCLLGTGDKNIIENSPFDSFYGCGADGKGENHMGKILVRLREELKIT